LGGGEERIEKSQKTLKEKGKSTMAEEDKSLWRRKR